MKTVRSWIYGLGILLILSMILLDILFLRTKIPGDAVSETFVDKRLSECGSFPNGSTQRVTETTRMFINIPKDAYPDVNVGVASHGATVGVVSNGGPYGYALGADQKPNCWSYYFEFNGVGTVDLSSKGASSTVPDYVVHFIVEKTK